MLLKYGSIPQYFFEFSDNLREWNASFKSKTDNTSHFELPSTENVSLTKGYAKLFFTGVMYGSVVWFLGLSRGIGSCMYYRVAL